MFDKPPRWAEFCKALNSHANILDGERAIAYHLPNQVSYLPSLLPSADISDNQAAFRVYAICKKAAQTKSSVRSLAPDQTSLIETPAGRAPHAQPAPSLRPQYVSENPLTVSERELVFSHSLVLVVY